MDNNYKIGASFIEKLWLTAKESKWTKKIPIKTKTSPFKETYTKVATPINSKFIWVMEACGMWKTLSF